MNKWIYFEKTPLFRASIHNVTAISPHFHWSDSREHTYTPSLHRVLIVTKHRDIILNRGSMFAFHWREFSPPLSSAHRLLQCYHRQKRDRRRCNSRGIPPQPPTTIGPLANERASWGTSRCDVAHSGRENLHQFLPILLWRHALSSSIMTLWLLRTLTLMLIFHIVWVNRWEAHN